MFRSARLKLTLFYLAILLLFSLTLTMGLRTLVQSEFNHANDVQRGAVHSIGLRFFGSSPSGRSDRDFAAIQRSQGDETTDRLNRETLLLNIFVLVVGAGISYWYAGRTLRPIEAAHEKQKRFTSDASHELRTPLASMRVENEVFLRQKKITEAEARQQISSNLEEVDRLERLAANLLALSRYEDSRLPRQKLDVHEIVAEAVASAKHNPNATHTIFIEKVTPGQVLGDQESLVQLVGILLDNAVKYGPAGGPIELTSKQQGGVYLLCVRDHGPGIGDEDLPHIFERMYRGDKARSSRTPGHGIGLSLALEIAHANDARLTAANHSQGGAEFTLQLSIAK